MYAGVLGHRLDSNRGFCDDTCAIVVSMSTLGTSSSINGPKVRSETETCRILDKSIKLNEDKSRACDVIICLLFGPCRRDGKTCHGESPHATCLIPHTPRQWSSHSSVRHPGRLDDPNDEPNEPSSKLGVVSEGSM